MVLVLAYHVEGMHPGMRQALTVETIKGDMRIKRLLDGDSTGKTQKKAEALL